MATTDSLPSPPSPASPDNDGLWMKLDFNTVADNGDMRGDDSLIAGTGSDHSTTTCPSVTSGISQHNSDTGAFMLPPSPSCTAPTPPTEGSISATKLCLRVTNGAGSVIEAKENPQGLHGHPGEKQVTITQNEEVEVVERDQSILKAEKSMDNTSPCDEMDSEMSTEPGQDTMDDMSVVTGTYFNLSLNQEANEAGLEELEPNTEGSEDIIVLSEEIDSAQMHRTMENNTERDRHLKQMPSSMAEVTGEETDNVTQQTKGEIKEDELLASSIGESEDIILPAEDTDSSQSTESDNNTVRSNSPTSPDPYEEPIAERETDSSPTSQSTCGPPEQCQCIKSNVDTESTEPEAPESLAEEDVDSEDSIDTRPLDYNITMQQWARRDSATSEVPLPQFPISRGSSVDHGMISLLPCETREGEGKKVKEEGMEKERTGSWTVSTDILQGEQLLQRLQALQQRQEVPETSEEPSPSWQTAQKTTNEAARDQEAGGCEFGVDREDLEEEAGDQIGGDEEDEKVDTNTEDVERTSRGLEEEREESGDYSTGGRAEVASSTASVQASHQRVTRMETDNSDDDQSDSGVSADFSPINTLEISSSQKSTIYHSTSLAAESEVDPTVLRKQSQQRTRGQTNSEEIPDVLEFPFKNITLPKMMPTKTGQGQSSEWQFSEQKMQKEISQEIQRELVLVNQGKIPGGYSKGTIRELKETKMLFEAFQQGQMEGPTRHRRPPSSSLSLRGHVYPSVLERTRSLEMLSLKSRPISRAHSLRLPKSRAFESLRCQSPEGMRDNSGSSTCSKQDNSLRPYRSMDSLNLDIPPSSLESGGRKRGAKTKDITILKENPFFKLRPALALQPEVVRDIQEAREREEELRRQRSTLYGETRRSSVDEDGLASKSAQAGARHLSKGKLDRIWPPPSKKEQINAEQTWEPRVHKPGSQKSSLWQRWEAGMINGQPPKEKN